MQAASVETETKAEEIEVPHWLAAIEWLPLSFELLAAGLNVESHDSTSGATP
jgi:hypothetical protein